MLGVMVAVFLVGYFCIAMEHKLEVNKAATALLTGGILWALYIVTSVSYTHLTLPTIA